MKNLLDKNSQPTLVILESPYSAQGGLHSVERNLHYARLCAMDCLNRHEAPFVSHLLYTQILNDTIPEQRALGIAYGLAWRSVAHYSVFYTDHGWSGGMLAALKSAREQNLRYEIRALYNAPLEPPQ